MATLETVLHDFLSLSSEERQRFLDMVVDDEDPDDEYWSRLKPELDRRLADAASGKSSTISGEESVRRIRERIRARRD